MTMLRNFDTELDTAGTTRIVTRVPAATETFTTKPTEKRTHLIADDEHWTWENVRDYVLTSIEQRFGAFPRNGHREDATFKSFVERWGDQAPLIAKAAFEVFDGYWRNAPVSVTRFCKNSDPYFASVIAERLSA